MLKEKFIPVGIDVGSTFSWMSIADPDETIISKPFKIIYNDVNSIRRALDAIKSRRADFHVISYISGLHRNLSFPTLLLPDGIRI